MFPNFSLFIEDCWAPGGVETNSFIPYSTNVVIGPNPPYTVADFLGYYPKFGGAPLVLTGLITLGSAVVTNLSGTAGLAVNQLVTGNQFASGTLIKSIDDTANTITLTNVANANAVPGQINVFTTPLVPLMVISLYVNLATSSLMSLRWGTQWPMAMALYIAHFCTLYLQSDGDTYNTPGQAAAAGLAKGILVSKSAGNVSAGVQPMLGGIEDWGSFNLTSYGQLFATFAAAIGAGPILCF